MTTILWMPPPTEPFTDLETGMVTEVWYRWLRQMNTPDSGLFTPILVTSGTDFASVTYDALTSGFYTKLGNVVLFSLSVTTDAVDTTGATGTVRIGGLPFASRAEVGGDDDFTAVSVGFADSWAGEEPISALVSPASNLINLYYRATVDGDVAATAITDVATGADGNRIYIAGAYFV